MSRRSPAAAVAGVVLLACLVAWGCRRAEKVPAATAEKDLTRAPEEWLREEPIRLLRDDIRIVTTEARGEREGAEFLQRIFDCADIPSEIVCPAPGRCNLLARLKGKTSEGSLLLLNHLDVVDAFPRFWKEAAPFEGTIKNGYLYGRGAYDMKSLAIAQALALRAIRERGIVPKTDILFLGEADEEVGQRWGSRWLLENRPEWFRGVTNVLNEGGINEMILRDVRFWGIETLQSGYATGEFESADSRKLVELARAWPRIESSPREPEPQVVEAFGLLANHLSYPLTDPLRHLDRVVRNPAELKALPDRYGAFLEARIFWSGPYHFPPDPKAPFRCYVIVSVPPRVDPKPFLDPIVESAPGRGVRVVHTFSGEPTTPSPYPTPLTDLLRRVTEAVYPGVPFGPLPTFGGYTTSTLFRQRGFAAYGYSPIPMNITDEARRHGNDERIYLRDYLDGVALYREALVEYALSN